MIFCDGRQVVKRLKRPGYLSHFSMRFLASAVVTTFPSRTCCIPFSIFSKIMSRSMISSKENSSGRLLTASNTFAFFILNKIWVQIYFKTEN